MGGYYKILSLESTECKLLIIAPETKTEWNV